VVRAVAGGAAVSIGAAAVWSGAAAGGAAGVSAEQADKHAGVQGADERHRQNECEREEGSVEHLAVARVGQ